jgi:hypothetical protein
LLASDRLTISNEQEFENKNVLTQQRGLGESGWKVWALAAPKKVVRAPPIRLPHSQRAGKV